MFSLFGNMTAVIEQKLFPADGMPQKRYIVDITDYYKIIPIHEFLEVIQLYKPFENSLLRNDKRTLRLIFGPRYRSNAISCMDNFNGNFFNGVKLEATFSEEIIRHDPRAAQLIDRLPMNVKKEGGGV